MAITNKIRMRRLNVPNFRRIKAIEEIRSATGKGLRESLDIVDACLHQTQTIEVDLNRVDITSLIRNLKDCGIQVE
jgi:ribosomal protein L7/L12